MATTGQFRNRLRPIPWRRVRALVRVMLLCAALLIVLQTSTPPPGDLIVGAAAHARDSLFNYVAWEADALAAKAFASLFGVQDYLDEVRRAELVRAYMVDLSAVLRLEAQIAAIYSDPATVDPAAASADRRAERDARRADLRNRQDMIESILEEQVSAVLVEEGLAVLGQVLPPVAIRFSPLPDVLIISPRDAIRVDASLSLDGLSVDQRDALEAAIDADLDVSSLVVDIGGMALYPSMVGETDALAWVIETIAHEWVHHYLFFFPLGWQYFDGGNPETRIINETTAEVLGKEIGRLVLARYYPDLLPPDAATPAPTPTPDPATFDFAAEMHRTRVTVDALLAEDRIAEAEAYMAERRAFFHANGYPIRKINQAYFAFYGGYQGASNFGTAGEDLIGPAIAALRAKSGSVARFLVTIRGITTREALLAAVNARAP
ncbi:MAG: hypothetical protein HPY64_03730 [Anaerolineae bacterium]|nr:hypothetical protein [Anaerolineae bacterium]